MKKIILSILLSLACANIFAAVDFNQIEDLYIHNKIDESQNYLMNALDNTTDKKVKAEILWKISRNYVAIGDKKEDKNEKSAIYEQGIEYAQQSIDLNESAMAHLWKCSNIGRLAQTKGIFESLGKAGPMRDELFVVVDQFKELKSSETWYVLATLYGSLPGGFISFGNNQYSISYYRIAIDTIPSSVIYPNHYKALAKKLYDRNWDKNKRKQEFNKLYSKWSSEKLNSAKYAYYEGKDKGNNIPYYSSVKLSQMSDRQEAVMLLSYAMNKYKAWPFHTDPETEGYNEVVQLYNDWT